MQRIRAVGPVVLAAAALCFGTRTAAADAAGTAPTFTSTAPTNVVVGGAGYTPTATVSPGDQLSFVVNPTTTTNAACAISNGVVSFAHAGSCEVDAEDTTNGTSAAQTITVAAAATTTNLIVGTSELTATVAAAAPGSGTPAGTIVFSVGGRVLGSSALVDGVATLAYTVPANVTEAILASFQGSADYTTSSATVTVNGPDIEPTFVAKPTIAAVLTSDARKNSRGWYHTKVRIHFICSGAGSPILGGCPRTLVLDRSGADLTVTRTIRTTSGRHATVALRGIKLDLTKPKVTIVGARNHALYHGTRPPVSCAATDKVSGIASCKVVTTVKRSSTLETIVYTAVATSWAGATQRVSETVYSSL